MAVIEFPGVAVDAEMVFQQNIGTFVPGLCPLCMPAEREVQFAVADKGVSGSGGLPLFGQFQYRTVIDPVFEVTTGHVPEFMCALSPAALVVAAVVQVEDVKDAFMDESHHIADPCIETVGRIIGTGDILKNAFLKLRTRFAKGAHVRFCFPVPALPAKQHPQIDWLPNCVFTAKSRY